MSEHPLGSADHRPAGNQFSLRGMFIFTTVVSAILALLALAIHEPYQWLGALGVAAFCLGVVGFLELLHKLFPPPPPKRYEFPPMPTNPMQTAYFRDLDNPFGPQPVNGDKIEVEDNEAKM